MTRRPSPSLFFVVVLVAVLLPGLAAAAPARIAVSATRIDIDLDFPAPSFRAGLGGVEARIGSLGSEADRPGEPRLPIAPLTLVLPPGTRVASVEVAGAPTLVPGTWRLAWGQEPQRIGFPTAPSTGPATSVYDSDAAYPDRIATIAGHGFFRGYRLATLRVRPLQVRPLSGQALLWSSVRVTLVLAPDGSAPDAAPRGSASDVAALAAFTANPETAAAYGPFAQAPAAADDAADVPWLVITPQSLAPAFERLVAHRTAHGMKGALRTLESVLASSPGEDDAAKVRAAIAQAYRDHGTTFVLLGGDDFDDAGTRLMPLRFCADYDNSVSDYYFGALDGSWDTDGDGRYCEVDEVDYYSEVHIGRATVDTLAEAHHFIDKVLLFEAGLAEDRRTDVVFMGENLDASTWGEDSKERIAPAIPAPFVIDRLYARNETFSAAAVRAALNRGPQLVNHDGHAGADYVMGIGIADVEALQNASPFAAYSIGCYPGAFDQGIMGNTESISEHYLLAPHAAAAVVMNSRYGWYFVGWDAGLSADLDKAFFDAIFVKGLATLGAANDDARAVNAPTAMTDGTMRYCFLETNLHGDPAMAAQLRRPQLRVASHRVIDGEAAYGNGSGVADPSETVEIAVTLANDGPVAATGVSARLVSSTPGVTVHDDWAAWPDLAAGASAENVPHHFTATLAVPCGTEVAFRLEMAHDGVVDVAMLTLTVGTVSEVPLRADDFEADTGWAAGGNAKQGLFVRADPNPTTDALRGVVQLGDDHTPGTGAVCWVTGNPATADPALGDLKTGNATLTSPTFDGTGEGRLLLRFARFFHRSNVGTGNTSWYAAKVSVDNGATFTEIERLESSAPRWTLRTIDLSSLATPSSGMKVRFEAYESMRYAQNGVTMTDLMIDDVSLVRRVASCTPFTPSAGAPPAPVGPTLRVSRACGDVVLSWTVPLPGAGHDAATSYPVYRSTSAAGGFTACAEPTETAWHDGACANAAYGHRFYLVASKNTAGTSGEEPTP